MFVAIHGTAPLLAVTGARRSTLRTLPLRSLLGVLAGVGARVFVWMSVTQKIS